MTDRAVEFDHAIFRVNDLDRAAEFLRREYGLGSAYGGRHPSGSENRIVPVGDLQYLELIVSTRPDSLVAELLDPVAQGRNWLSWWSVRPTDLNAVASRLGSAISEGSIEFEDGTTGSWASTGMKFPLPFFVEYHDTASRRQRRQRLIVEANHPVEPVAVVGVELGDPPDVVESWLGATNFEVSWVSGAPGIRSVTLDTAQGLVTLGPELGAG